MDTTERTSFGRRLFESREAVGLTQDQVAVKIGMSQGTLGEAETSGKRSGYTSQLAALYKVDPVWLATGKDPTKKTISTSLKDANSTRKLIQDVLIIAETISDLGLKHLLLDAHHHAEHYPLRGKQKRAKAA